MLSVWATILLVLAIIRHNWNSIMSIFYWRWPFLKIQQSPFSFQFPFYVLLHALCSFLLVGSCRFLTPVCAHRRLRQNLPHTLLGHKSLLLYMRNEGSFSAESTSREIITASQLIIFGSIAPKHHPCQWIFFFLLDRENCQMWEPCLYNVGNSVLIASPVPLWLYSTDMYKS